MPPKQSSTFETKERRNKVQQKEHPYKLRKTKNGAVTVEEPLEKESVYHAFNRLLRQEDFSDLLSLAKLKGRGPKDSGEKSENKDSSSLEDALEDLWSTPLVKEHFDREKNNPNIAVCKLCFKKLQIGFGKCVKLEHHLIKIHRAQYEQYEKVYKLKPPLKTYTRFRAEIKNGMNKDSTGGQESENRRENEVDMALKDTWSSPLLKEFFIKIHNTVVCKLCETRFKVLFGRSLVWESHLQVKHALQYEKFQKLHARKPPLKTYSRTSFENKCQLNSDAVKSKEHQKFDDLLHARKPPLKTYSHTSFENKSQLNSDAVKSKEHQKFDDLINSKDSQDINRHSSTQDNQDNPSKNCNPGIPYKPLNAGSSKATEDKNKHNSAGDSKATEDVNKNNSAGCSKVTEDVSKNNSAGCSKATEDVSKNNSVSGGWKLSPDELKCIKSVKLSLKSKNSEDVEVILPYTWPKKMNIVIKMNQESVHSNNLAKVINSGKVSDAGIIRRNPVDIAPYLKSSPRTYSRTRKALVLTDNQGAASVNGTDFPPCQTSLPNVETVFQDRTPSPCVTNVDTRIIQTACEKELNIVSISQDVCGDFRVSENQECILPDLDPAQLKRPKVEPPDTYEQENSNVKEIMILPTVPHFTGWVKKEPE